MAKLKTKLLLTSPTPIEVKKMSLVQNENGWFNLVLEDQNKNLYSHAGVWGEGINEKFHWSKLVVDEIIWGKKS